MAPGTMPSLGSSPSRRAVEGRPVEAQADAVGAFETVQTVSNSVRWADAVNQSPRGPGASSTSSSSSCGAPHGATTAAGIGATASPRDRDDVAGAQRARAESGEQIGRPRAERRRARRVRRGRPGRRGRRARTSRGAAPRPPASDAPRTGRPPVRRGGSCPTRRSPRTSRSTSAVARKPPIVTSMPAAPSGLPRSRFAVRRAARSSAPDDETPSGCRSRPPEILQRRQQPGLDDADARPLGPAMRSRRAVGSRPRREPRARRAVRRVAAASGELAHRAEAHARSRCQERRGRGIRIEQAALRRADEPPAARGLARVGAGESGGEADRPRGHAGAGRRRGEARRTASRR